MSGKVFDRLANRYDAWFETQRGAAIFRAELECLRRLLPRDLAGWVEVGVGTGRFASALGIPEGVDPSLPMLEIAARRGILTRKGSAEHLPCPDASVAGILLVVTLCFVDDPDRTVQESARVLRPGGRLLVGIVRADSPWGAHYRLLGEEGHPFYSAARFYTCRQVRNLAEGAGFRFAGGASTLFSAPGGKLRPQVARPGIVPGSGFVAMRFRRPRSGARVP
jgi:ubiquinone/menaquinone biosynthesis C-methylase UbiE